jgi:hypothetical protein
MSNRHLTSSLNLAHPPPLLLHLLLLPPPLLRNACLAGPGPLIPSIKTHPLAPDLCQIEMVHYFSTNQSHVSLDIRTDSDVLSILRDHFASQEERDRQNAHEVTSALRDIKDTLLAYLELQGKMQTVILDALGHQESTQTAILQTQTAMLQALERSANLVSYFKVRH